RCSGREPFALGHFNTTGQDSYNKLRPLTSPQIGQTKVCHPGDTLKSRCSLKAVACGDYFVLTQKDLKSVSDKTLLISLPAASRTEGP
ncbi:hypothetical protein EI555_012249, partial [Monodon monoceros]